MGDATCSADDEQDACTRRVAALDLCQKHYARHRRDHGTSCLPQRCGFAARVALARNPCGACGRRLPVTEMRYPGREKGSVSLLCRPCRQGHPGQSWCSGHDAFHPVCHFTKHRDGLQPKCREFVATRSAERDGRAVDPIHCKVCQRDQHPSEFLGTMKRRPICRSCIAEHPEHRWCSGCCELVPRVEFSKPVDHFCRACRQAAAHHTTVEAILARQGVTRRECGACGATTDLAVDHAHDCCPGPFSQCGRCVRGYLCTPCNVAEGLLRTAERAEQLARYMRRTKQLQIPISNRE